MGRRRLAILWAAAAVALAVGTWCVVAPGFRSEDVAASRARALARAARHVQRTLLGALSRARAAVAATEPALAAAGEDRARRFDALEDVRARADVTGLLWEPQAGVGAWAGTPVEPRELPAAPPWQASFRTADTTFHAGPFLRALLVERGGVVGGSVTATVVLADPEASPFDGTFEEQWAAKEGVKAIRVLAPDAAGRPAGPAVLRVGVRGARDAQDLMTVEVEAPSDDALVERMADRGRRATGFLALVALLAAGVGAVLAARRFVANPAGRAAALAAIALLVRGGLAALDLAGRLRELAPAFDTSDFGIVGWLGWLKSPGDFLLTGTAIAAAAAGVARALASLSTPARPAGRALAIAAGGALAVLSTALWLSLVAVAAFHGRIDYFAPGPLIPSIPRTVMLSGLAAVTAGSWLLARGGLVFAGRAAPPVASRPLRFLGAVAAGVAVGAVASTIAPGSFPAWTPLLVPLAAALLGGVGGGARGAGTPSRVVLVSVLSAVLLFPALWVGVREAARSDLMGQVADLVRREEQVSSSLASWLEPLVSDAHLVGSLSAAAERKPVPDGLALHAWLRMPFGGASDDGAIVVLDVDGKRLDRFGLDTPPFDRMPPATARGVAREDVSVETGVEGAGLVRTTIGRARVRNAAGRIVGTVVALVPDALSTTLSGHSPRLAAGPMGAGADPRRVPDLPMSLVLGSRVTATNDPEAPRSAPPVVVDAASLVEPTWLSTKAEDGSEWLAVPAGARGVLLARRAPGGMRSVLFALARLSIVAVGLGGAVAFLLLVAGVRRFRPRLQGKILGSYFAISVLPVVILGIANWRDTQRREEDDFRGRQDALVAAARQDIQTLGSELFKDPNVAGWAVAHDYDLSLYRDGSVSSSSLQVLVQAELLPARLPGRAYRATELDGRDVYRGTETFAGGVVRVGYAPVRDEAGNPIATVAVPLRYDAARAEQEAAQAGSVLLAAYLLTLVLIVVIGIYTARNLARPLDLLAEGTKRVAAGETDLAIPGGGTDEIGSLVDAFNRMTGELKAVRARAAVAEREAAWRGMARQVAHEIKNPLTPMKLMLQQLVATARTDPEYAARTVEPTAKIVLEQIEALSRIASDFSAFARFPPRDVREEDVNAVLRSVAALYAAGEAPVASVVTDLAEGLPPVRWDRDELRRVFVNLVANAVQALDEAKGRVRVEVASRAGRSLTSGREGVLVTIADDGVGIAPENRAHLFEPDFSTKSAGTGLGLAIVRRVLTDLGGEIAIDSTPGRGTKVTVWMPAAPAAR